MSDALAIGIDLGTSGARAIIMTEGFEVIAQAAAPLARFGADGRAPDVWWAAVEAVLGDALAQVDRNCIRAIAIDGTSGTVLALDAAGSPLATPLMYNDRVEDQALLARIAGVIAPASAAHGPTSGLAKALAFQPIPGIARTLHQADWIAGRLTGSFEVTDENNALKTGYDPVSGTWPDWIQDTGLRPELLPRVVQPSDPIGGLQPEIARHLGLSPKVMIVAGTTDGCASFLATGADLPGDAVSALGSTLTLKLLSDEPIFAPEYGIYSHRINGMWLAGGASNTGGRVLAHYFSSVEIERLSAQIDTQSETGLDYYPLLEPGERFPIQDASYPPRLTPRPPDDATFLKAMFDGIAAIEQLGYRRLVELGAPPLRSVRSVGGGAGNPQWTAIRQRKLGVPFLAAQSDEAAAGTARLALAGARKAGLI
jgi:D-ribulokinase